MGQGFGAFFVVFGLGCESGADGRGKGGFGRLHGICMAFFLKLNLRRKGLHFFFIHCKMVIVVKLMFMSKLEIWKL